MSHSVIAYLFVGLTAPPFFYYLIAIYSSWRFFRNPEKTVSPEPVFTPPVSILKPVRGLDLDAYENFASFCRQDYPEYEVVFCVTKTDAVLSVIEKLQRDFPERNIRVLFGSESAASNDKVAKLTRLAAEAQHEYLVISDSDVRVGPDYLRSVVAPLANPEVGGVTCMYVPAGEKSFAEKLQNVGMASDFFAGVLVARQLDGVKFAFGQTIATTRTRLAEFGGYAKLENRPADDLLVGRLIAEQGYRIELSHYVVETVPDYQSMRELIHKRLRWIVVMRHMRPWGHFGLAFTQGLPWALIGIAVHPSRGFALAYLGTYLLLRIALTWIIGIRGLKSRGLWKNIPLIVVWDGIAFIMWLASFARNSVRWRGGYYYIRDGMLIPATSRELAD